MRFIVPIAAPPLRAPRGVRTDAEPSTEGAQGEGGDGREASPRCSGLGKRGSWAEADGEEGEDR